MNKNVKLIIVILVSVIIMGLLYLLFNNRINSYNYIYKNISIEEDTNIGTNFYVVNKGKSINTKSRQYKKVMDKQIDELLKQEIDFENMIILYNPYDTNKYSIRLYFITNYDVRVNYKLTTNKIKNDFTLLGYNYTTQHRYEISDISLGTTNILEFELRDKDNKLRGTNKIELNLSNIK